MPKEKPPSPLTLAELRARADIPKPDRDRMEALAVRLIQIQDETHTLETERGYSRGGKRIPGIADEMETLCVKHSVRGLAVEDFTVTTTHGSNSRIDRNLLLAEGVLAESINASTVTSYWTGITVKRKGERDE